MHILVGFRPDHENIFLYTKSEKRKFKMIKARKLAPSFAWQDGYSAFSYSKAMFLM